MRGAILTFLIMAVLFAACTARNIANPTDSLGVSLEACQLSGPSGTLGRRAQCGSLRVYEDRTAGSGRQIDLHLAVIPAVSRSPQPDPLFISGRRPR
jgi:hypothetical protein